MTSVTLEKTFNWCRRNLCQIQTINYVEENQISSSACVIRIQDQYHIFVNKKLPEAVATFCILHECGHVALNLFNYEPYSQHTRTDELRVNFWVCDLLEVFLPIHLTRELKKQFSLSEDEGFRYFEANCFNQYQKALHENTL